MKNPDFGDIDSQQKSDTVGVEVFSVSVLNSLMDPDAPSEKKILRYLAEWSMTKITERAPALRVLFGLEINRDRSQVHLMVDTPPYSHHQFSLGVFLPIVNQS